MNERYIAKTKVGRFRVEKTKEHLKIGGSKFCVEIRFNESSPETSELQWLITKNGGCELDDIPINGSATVHLLHLSFTLLRKYVSAKFIKLLDNSKFDCQFADGSKTTIFMNKYNYLFYGGTWYDTKLGAFPLDSVQRELYNETKELFNDPSAKGPFDFRNLLLNEELMPLYEKAGTWKEFADILHKQYSKVELCRKIAPWYSYAVAALTKNRMLPEYWIIDISSIAPIDYTQFSSGGGTRKTRKRPYFTVNDDCIILSPDELYNKLI